MRRHKLLWAIVAAFSLLAVLVFKYVDPTQETQPMTEYQHVLGSFRYPTGWQANPNDLGSEEIPVNIELINPGNNLYGFVQVWKIKGGINTLLNPANAKNPNLSDITIKHMEKWGKTFYLIDYRTKNKEPRRTKEALFQQDSYVYRLMLNAPVQAWTEELDKTLFDIAKSMEIKLK